MTKLSDDDQILVNAIGNLIDEKIKDLAETTLVTKNDIKHLPTKEEYYRREDETMKELKAVREEITILSGLQSQVHDHEEKLEKIFHKLSLNPTF